MSHEENLIEIESRIALQENTIQILGEEVFRLQKKLEQLESTCNFLVEQLKAQSGATLPADTETEKPPHY